MSDHTDRPARPSLPQRALNHVVKEAIDYTIEQGFSSPALLFGVVQATALADVVDDDSLGDQCPLVLVLQDIADEVATSEETLDEYLVRITWPPQVAGAVLSRHISFTEGPGSPTRSARLVTGVLRSGEQTTVLVTTDEPGEPVLHGGDSIAPKVVDVLRQGLSD